MPEPEGLGRGTVQRPNPPVTIFLPVYNEAGSIARVLREFSEVVVQPLGAELLVCEDGSTDGTDHVLAQLAREIPMRLVSSRDRKGFARAVADGLRMTQSEWVFFADSDGQYDPRDFWKIWAERDGHDLIIGRKLHREEKFYRALLSFGFHVLVKAIASVPLKDMDCGFRLMRREVVQDVLPRVRFLKYSFNAEFAILSYRRGYRIGEVVVSHRPSLEGDTSIYTWNRIPRIILSQVDGLRRLGSYLREADPRRYPTGRDRTAT